MVSAGGGVGCRMKRSRPRTFSSMRTNISPSAKRRIVRPPRGTPRVCATSSASRVLAVPERTMSDPTGPLANGSDMESASRVTQRWTAGKHRRASRKRQATARRETERRPTPIAPCRARVPPPRFERGLTAPKAAVLPLHQGGSIRARSLRDECEADRKTTDGVDEGQSRENGAGHRSIVLASRVATPIAAKLL